MTEIKEFSVPVMETFAPTENDFDVSELKEFNAVADEYGISPAKLRTMLRNKKSIIKERDGVTYIIYSDFQEWLDSYLAKKSYTTTTSMIMKAYGLKRPAARRRALFPHCPWIRFELNELQHGVSEEKRKEWKTRYARFNDGKVDLTDPDTMESFLPRSEDLQDYQLRANIGTNYEYFTISEMSDYAHISRYKAERLAEEAGAPVTTVIRNGKATLVFYRDKVKDWYDNRPETMSVTEMAKKYHLSINDAYNLVYSPEFTATYTNARKSIRIDVRKAEEWFAQRKTS
jgi:hypothetical protein